jgi:hypothetical protein
MHHFYMDNADDNTTCHAIHVLGPVPLINLQWNIAIFAILFIIEGTTEKVMQYIMPLKSIYNRNFGFIEHKMYF